MTIAQKIDRLAEIKAEKEKLKQEKDVIEAELMKTATDDLANTKYKSVTYHAEKAKLTATTAESVKVTYEAFLPLVFGKAYSECCKTKSSVELTAPAKRLIAGIWKDEYIRSTVDEVIKSMGLDSKTEKLVAKKCKGINFDKDKLNLITVAGMTEEQANENAYLLMEAAVWQQFTVLLELNDISKDAGNTQLSELLQKIQAAFVVEETPKISVEAI